MGLDISSSVTGVVLINSETDDVLLFDYIKLDTTKLDNIFDKADYVKSWLEKNIIGYDVQRIFVEAHAKMFTKGFTSADTLFTLAKMNALVSYIAKKLLSAEVIDINVTSARSKIGYKNNTSDKRPVKEKTREFVLKTYPNLPIKTYVAKAGKNKGNLVMKPEMADCVDAFVICMGGRKIVNLLNTVGEKEDVKTNNKRRKT